jgi:hypothetical protein
MSRGGTPAAHKFFEAVTGGIVALLRRASAHQARLAPKPGQPPAASAAHSGPTAEAI